MLWDYSKILISKREIFKMEVWNQDGKSVAEVFSIDQPCCDSRAAHTHGKGKDLQLVCGE